MSGLRTALSAPPRIVGRFSRDDRIKFPDDLRDLLTA